MRGLMTEYTLSDVERIPSQLYSAHYHQLTTYQLRPLPHVTLTAHTSRTIYPRRLQAAIKKLLPDSAVSSHTTASLCGQLSYRFHRRLNRQVRKFPSTIISCTAARTARTVLGRSSKSARQIFLAGNASVHLQRGSLAGNARRNAGGPALQDVMNCRDGATLPWGEINCMHAADVRGK